MNKKIKIALKIVVLSVLAFLTCNKAVKLSAQATQAAEVAAASGATESKGG